MRWVVACALSTSSRGCAYLLDLPWPPFKNTKPVAAATVSPIAVLLEPPQGANTQTTHENHIPRHDDLHEKIKDHHFKRDAELGRIRIDTVALR